jgi:hypothetical protein
MVLMNLAIKLTWYRQNKLTLRTALNNQIANGGTRADARNY